METSTRGSGEVFLASYMSFGVGAKQSDPKAANKSQS